MLKIKVKWEGDTGQQIMDKQGLQICKNNTCVSTNAKFKMIQFKYMHLIYVTLAKLKLSDSSLIEYCPRCVNTYGTFMHMIWECPAIVGF